MHPRSIGGHSTLALAAVGLLSALAAYLAQPSLALFTDQRSVGANVFSADTLDAPTGSSASGGVSIILNWTATSDTYASGHRVYRSGSSGGPYTQIAQVTPRTETTYTDNPSAGTYYYVVRGYFQNWESANGTQVSTTKQSTTDTGYHDPSADAPVTSGSGDNNGFETNPTYAYSDSSLGAQDLNSGSNTSTSCSECGQGPPPVLQLQLRAAGRLDGQRRRSAASRLG